jgi:ATP-dependent Zn protease
VFKWGLLAAVLGTIVAWPYLSSRVDEEIRALVMHGYETARQIVERHRPALVALANELLELESVEGERLREILAGTAGAA